jgi:hypothetical protein
VSVYVISLSVKLLYVSNFSANAYITIGYQRNNCRNQNHQQLPSMSGTNSRITRLQRSTPKLHVIIMSLRIKEKREHEKRSTHMDNLHMRPTLPLLSTNIRPRHTRIDRGTWPLGAEEPGRCRRAPGQCRRPPGQLTATLRWVGGATSLSRLVGDGTIAGAQAGLNRKQGIC